MPPKKLPTTDLQAEEVAANSPLRRSSRIVSHVSAEVIASPAKTTRRRASQDDEANKDKEADAKGTARGKKALKLIEEETAPPASPGRPRRRASTSSEVSDVTPKPRGRRASITTEPVHEEPPKVQPTKTRGRRSSVTDVSKVTSEPTEEPEKPKPKSRRSSISATDLEEKPTPIRKRRNSNADSISSEVSVEGPESSKKPIRPRGQKSVEPEEAAPKPTRTRRRSTDVEQTEISEKPKVTRSRRSSTEAPPPEPVQTPRATKTRRASLSNMEPIEETETENSPKIKTTPIKPKKPAVEVVINLEPIKEVEVSEKETPDVKKAKEVTPPSVKRSRRKILSMKIEEPEPKTTNLTQEESKDDEKQSVEEDKESSVELKDDTADLKEANAEVTSINKSEEENSSERTEAPKTPVKNQSSEDTPVEKNNLLTPKSTEKTAIRRSPRINKSETSSPNSTEAKSSETIEEIKQYNQKEAEAMCSKLEPFVEVKKIQCTTMDNKITSTTVDGVDGSFEFHLNLSMKNTTGSQDEMISSRENLNSSNESSTSNKENLNVANASKIIDIVTSKVEKEVFVPEPMEVDEVVVQQSVVLQKDTETFILNDAEESDDEVCFKSSENMKESLRNSLTALKPLRKSSSPLVTKMLSKSKSPVVLKEKNELQNIKSKRSLSPIPKVTKDISENSKSSEENTNNTTEVEPKSIEKSQADYDFSLPSDDDDLLEETDNADKSAKRLNSSCVDESKECSPPKKSKLDESVKEDKSVNEPLEKEESNIENSKASDIDQSKSVTESSHMTEENTSNVAESLSKSKTQMFDESFEISKENGKATVNIVGVTTDESEKIKKILKIQLEPITTSNTCENFESAHNESIESSDDINVTLNESVCSISKRSSPILDESKMLDESQDISVDETELDQKEADKTEVEKMEQANESVQKESESNHEKELDEAAQEEIEKVQLNTSNKQTENAKDKDESIVNESDVISNQTDFTTLEESGQEDVTESKTLNETDVSEKEEEKSFDVIQSDKSRNSITKEQDVEKSNLQVEDMDISSKPETHEDQDDPSLSTEQNITEGTSEDLIPEKEAEEIIPSSSKSPTLNKPEEIHESMDDSVGQVAENTEEEKSFDVEEPKLQEDEDADMSPENNKSKNDLDKSSIITEEKEELSQDRIPEKDAQDLSSSSLKLNKTTESQQTEDNSVDQLTENAEETSFDVVKSDKQRRKSKSKKQNDEEPSLQEDKDADISSDKKTSKKHSKKAKLETSEDLDKSTISEAEKSSKAATEHSETESLLDEVFSDCPPEASSKTKKEENQITEAISPKKQIKPKSEYKKSLEEFASSKMDKFLNNKLKELVDEDSSDEDSEKEEYNDFIDGMAEEGEEDTPSEDSNEIVDEGESVGFSEDDSKHGDSDYEEDSFICDDEEIELLSGNEDEELEKKTKKNKKKGKDGAWSRIVAVSESSEDEAEKEDVNKEVKNDKSLEVIEVPEEDPVETCNRRSSLTIQENINVAEGKQSLLGQRINSLVESFCNTIKSKGEISLNLSLDFEQSEPSAKESIPKSPKEKTDKKEKSKSLERLSVTLDDEDVETDVIEVVSKNKRRLSKSLEDISAQTKKGTKKSKKRKHTNDSKKTSKKIKPNKADVVEDLRKTTFNLMDQLVIDVKNRERRTIKPSMISDPDYSWTEVQEVMKPSKSNIMEPPPKPKSKDGTFHPRDFRNQMLNDKSRVRRMDSVEMLKNKLGRF